MSARRQLGIVRENVGVDSARFGTISQDCPTTGEPLLNF